MREVYKNEKWKKIEIKTRSTKLYYSTLIAKYKYNIINTWFVIKEAIGKEKNQQQNFRKKFV